MMPDEGESGPATAGEGVAPLLADLRELAGEARDYAAAELALQTSRVRTVGIGVRRMALFGVFALMFVIFAIGGLTVGLLLALTPLVTAWGATAIVVGLWVLIALGCVRAAMGAWARMRRSIAGPVDEQT